MWLWQCDSTLYQLYQQLVRAIAVVYSIRSAVILLYIVPILFWQTLSALFVCSPTPFISAPCPSHSWSDPDTFFHKLVAPADDEVAADDEGEKADEPKVEADEEGTSPEPKSGGSKKLTNQFNYSERASQTYNNPYRVSSS